MVELRCEGELSLAWSHDTDLFSAYIDPTPTITSNVLVFTSSWTVLTPININRKPFKYTEILEKNLRTLPQ